MQKRTPKWRDNVHRAAQTCPPLGDFGQSSRAVTGILSTVDCRKTAERHRHRRRPVWKRRLSTLPSGVDETRRAADDGASQNKGRAGCVVSPPASGIRGVVVLGFKLAT